MKREIVIYPLRDSTDWYAIVVQPGRIYGRGPLSYERALTEALRLKREQWPHARIVDQAGHP
ncbi:hypothetical protein NKJ66_07310 [Mesorhizobium sp. M0078]|uniref:hypothetical protein n=1 Tax=Mesorhizobium sp. M0078 TaxID=2956871 RepID=UPI0033389029